MRVPISSGLDNMDEIINKQTRRPMFVRKSHINHLIEKERRKERALCMKEKNSEIADIRKYTRERREKELKEMKTWYEHVILQKESDIRRLQKEIDNHYETYREIREREAHLDTITSEVEQEVERMLLKVHESTQPFLRARNKVERIKNVSNKGNSKVESIFSKVK